MIFEPNNLQQRSRSEVIQQAHKLILCKLTSALAVEVIGNELVGLLYWLRAHTSSETKNRGDHQTTRLQGSNTLEP